MTRRMELAARTALVLGMVASLGACSKKPGVATVPKTPEARVEAIAQQLPVSADGAFVMSDVKQAQTIAASFKERFGQLAPEIEEAQKEAQSELGFDLLQPGSTAQAGLAAENSVVIASVNTRMVIATFVEDRAKADAFLAEKFQKALNVKTPPKSEKAGEVELKVLSKSADEKIVWAYNGKLLVIGMQPGKEQVLPGTPADVAKIVGDIVKPGKKDPAQSLASNAMFKKVRTTFGKDYPIQVALNITPALLKEAEEAAKSDEEKKGLEWVKKNADGFGIGVKGSETSLHVRGMLSTTSAYTATIKAINEGVTKSVFPGFATDKALLVLRSGFNFEKAWPLYQTTLPKEQVTQMQAMFKQNSEKLGMSFEDDVVKNYTGNAGVYFYGLDMMKAMMAFQTKNLPAVLQSLHLAIGLQFKDAKKLNALVDKVLELAKAQEMALESSEKDGIRTIALPDGAGSIYIKEGAVVLATPLVTGEKVAALFAGKEPKLTSDLGKPFAEEAPTNGLFVNVQQIASLIPGGGGMPQLEAVKQIKEASLTVDANDSGMFADLQVALTPPAPKIGRAHV